MNTIWIRQTARFTLSSDNQLFSKIGTAVEVLFLTKETKNMDRKIAKKKYSWQKMVGYSVGLTGMAFLFYSIITTSNYERLNVAANRILLDTVQYGLFQEFIPITGIVQPIKTVFLDAVEGGSIEKIFVEDGSALVPGQKILQLSNPDLQMSYLNQEAQTLAQINTLRNTSILMEQQRLRLQEQALEVIYRIDQLEKSLARNKSLLQDQVIARIEYEQIEDEYEHLLRRKKLLATTITKDSLFQAMQKDQMASSLKLMQENLIIAKSGLKNLVVKAPIAGQLSSFELAVGELLQKGENIAQIDATNNFKVTAQIDEYYLRRIFIGQQGSWKNGDKVHTLTIRKIYPEVKQGSFQVDLVFQDTAPELIKRGQSISIRMALSNEIKTLQLAKGNFYQATGGNWIYWYDAARKIAIKKEIKIGRQNPLNYEILQGLKAGDLVITSSYEAFEDMDQLKIN